MRDERRNFSPCLAVDGLDSHTLILLKCQMHTLGGGDLIQFLAISIFAAFYNNLRSLALSHPLSLIIQLLIFILFSHTNIIYLKYRSFTFAPQKSLNFLKKFSYFIIVMIMFNSAPRQHFSRASKQMNLRNLCVS